MFDHRGFHAPVWAFGILVASLSGGVLSAATVGASAGTVLSGTYSLDQNLYSGYIVYDGTSQGNPASGILSVGNLDSTAGQSVAYSYTLPIDLGTGAIALLALDSAAGVALTANDAVAPSYIGSPWPYSESEVQIGTDIQMGSSTALVSFLDAHSTDFFYAPGTTDAIFLTFSNGQPIGTMSLTATATPEPLSLLLVFSGLLLLANWKALNRKSSEAKSVSAISD